MHFDENGDGPGRYTIMNYQRNRTTREYEYKLVGTWADSLLDLDLSKIIWAGGTMDIPRSLPALSLSLCKKMRKGRVLWTPCGEGMV